MAEIKLKIASVVIGSGEGGGSGVAPYYADLPDKPSINGETLSGDMSSEDLGLASESQAVPSGGTTGQVLAKKSNADNDVQWVNQESGGQGTTDYADLENKPKINNVTLSGNKTAAQLGLQAELVSGTNIKTINNQSIVGSGNITIEGGGTNVEANPSGSATEILESIGINGVKYSIKESEEYDETQLMPTATWYNKSSLDANGDSGINVFAGQNQTDGHYASMYEINISGYSKIKITAPSVGSYISITKKKLPYGASIRGQQMVDEYVELCPGFIPNNGAASVPKTRMAVPSNEFVEITLTSDAKYLYVVKQFSSSMSDYTPTSVVGFMTKKEEQEGSSHNVGLEINEGTITETGTVSPMDYNFYTSPISLSTGFFIRLHDPYRIIRVILYDKDNNVINYGDSFYDEGWKEWGLDVILPQYYVRLLISAKTNYFNSISDNIVEQFVTFDDSRLHHESPVNTGTYSISLQNWILFKRRVRQFVNPTWYALEYIPRSETNFLKGTINRGIPYSEVNEYSKFVGQHVSFRTFLSALLNIRSVMYTEDIRTGSAQKTKYGITYHGMYDQSRSYYGAVCTSLTSYVLGLNDIVVSYKTDEIPGLIPIAKGTHTSKWQKTSDGGNTWEDCNKDEIWEMVNPMDLIFYTGHCSLAGDVFLDEDGERKFIDWIEQTTPRGRIIPYSKDGFLNRLESRTETADSGGVGGYKQWIIYRYENWNNMGSEKVRFNEPEDTPYIQTNFMMYSPQIIESDPDIQICLGDYPAIACTDGAFQQTIPFCFNVHRGGKYTTLQIFNESDNVESSNPVATIDISSNVSGQIYNSTDIESDDAEDKDDWIVADMRSITLGITLTSGKYKARVTDGTESSGFTHFELVDISEFSYNPSTTTVQFSTESGTPYLVRLETDAGLARGSWDLTEGDITNGYKVLTNINPTTDNHILKILVKADYGVVTKTIDLNQ